MTFLIFVFFGLKMKRERPHIKEVLLDKKKTARCKHVKYHGLTRVIDSVWDSKPKRKPSQQQQQNSWCGYRDALAHGNAVDREISAYAKLGHEAFIEQKGRRVDPCTLEVIQFFKRKSLRPLPSQYILYDCASCIKTHLDVLAEDDEGQLVLIELKATVAGDDDSYRAAAKHDVLRLSGGYTLPNSYYNRNMIQLVMMLKMFYLRYNVLVRRGYVVRVRAGSLWCYPTDGTVLSLHERIYETLKATTASWLPAGVQDRHCLQHKCSDAVAAEKREKSSKRRRRSACSVPQ